MDHLRGKGISLDKVLQKHEDLSVRRTKIVCTIGPACWEVDKICQLIDAGMNVARLNFSHGDHEVHGRTVARIREAVAQRPGAHVAIMLDTKGPEIRTGMLENGQEIDLVAGQELFISIDYELRGNNRQIACSYKQLPQSVQVGNVVLAADGNIVMRVTEIRDDGIVVQVMSNATLGERKNMNLPGVAVQLPTMTDKDRDDIVNFGVKYGVDLIAASFVREGKDIDEIRSVLGQAGAHIKIIAKIENQQGLENFDAILDRTDGIMVARGDLGMELPPEKVFLAQKMMIRKCNLFGKPVVTATQMLDSMIKNPRPTRAECTDVANAVLDGTDAVMLSGETANGLYFRESVEMMARVCVEAESVMNHKQLYNAVRASTIDELVDIMPTQEAIASSAVKTAIDCDAKCIIVCSETGNSARLVSKYRPGMPVLVLTATDWVARQVSGILRGSNAVQMGSMIGTESILLRAIEMVRDRGWVATGDCVVAVHGQLEGRPGSTNLCKVLTVS